MVIIDTSSILFGISMKKDVFQAAKNKFPGCTLTISKGILRELSGLSRSTGRRSASAKTALALIRVKNVKVDNDNRGVDSWVYRTAKHNNFIVITNDTALFRKVKRINQKVFRLSKNGFLK